MASFALISAAIWNILTLSVIISVSYRSLSSLASLALFSASRRFSSSRTSSSSCSASMKSKSCCTIIHCRSRISRWQDCSQNSTVVAAALIMSMGLDSATCSSSDESERESSSRSEEVDFSSDSERDACVTERRTGTFLRTIRWFFGDSYSLYISLTCESLRLRTFWDADSGTEEGGRLYLEFPLAILLDWRVRWTDCIGIRGVAGPGHSSFSLR
mmetsp:Transcript_6571/g.12069  ORF Transcript_6571/g.12069 Transcript_6571/m.12069 type:complete len:215 (+) Transcript_6571:780-1424(+)